VAIAMKHVSEKAPGNVSVRPNHTVHGTAHDRRGVVVRGRYDVNVRQLSVRVPERQLVPANIVGG
jgi:3-phenylpropionate/cinnamic acid dioxygenase small subunit